MSDVGKYGKAIVAALTSGLITLQAILVSTPADKITLFQWITVALAVLIPGGATYAVKNSGTAADSALDPSPLAAWANEQDASV